VASRWAVASFVLVSLLGSLLFYLRVPGFALFVPDGTEVSVDRLLSALTRLSHPFIGLSNDYAPLLGFAAFLLLGWGRERVGRFHYVWSIVGWCAVLGLVLTFSRGVGAAFVLVAAWLTVRGLASVRWWLILVVIGAMLTAAISVAADRITVRVGTKSVPVSALVDDRFRSSANVSNRTNSYSRTLEMVAERPWTGFGGGVLDPQDEGALVEASHNTVLQQMLFFGVPLGALAGLSWLLLPALVAWRSAGFPAATVARRNALVGAVAFLVLASLTQTFMEATAPRLIVYLLLGFALGELDSAPDSAPEAH
jgi:O-antigen ligase